MAPGFEDHSLANFPTFLSSRASISFYRAGAEPGPGPHEVRPPDRCWPRSFLLWAWDEEIQKLTVKYLEMFMVNGQSSMCNESKD